MCKKWKPKWFCGIDRPELRWWPKTRGFARRTGFGPEKEWWRLCWSGKERFGWRRRRKGRESGVVRRSGVGGRSENVWRAKGGALKLRQVGESGGRTGECLGVCVALSGWIAVHGLDESVGKESQNSPSRKRGEVHPKSAAGPFGRSLAQKNTERGDAGRGSFQAVHSIGKAKEVEEVFSDENPRSCPATSESLGSTKNLISCLPGRMAGSCALPWRLFSPRD